MLPETTRRYVNPSYIVKGLPWAENGYGAIAPLMI